MTDPTGLRAFIFGDCALEQWPAADADVDGEPWTSFVDARDAMARGVTVEAVALWRDIAARPGLESRHTLQAWHFLRSVGEHPPRDVAEVALGAVAEVAVPGGHDLLAAYADGSVRYLNFSGAATVIDEPIPTIEPAVRALLDVSQTIVAAIGPWEGPLPDLPDGSSRLTMLTPSGPHFGQGPDAALRGDAMAGAFFDAATQLLVAVVELSGRER